MTHYERTLNYPGIGEIVDKSVHTSEYMDNLSWENFIKQPHIIEWVSEGREHLNPDYLEELGDLETYLTSSVQVFYQLFMMKMHGEKVFDLTEDAANMLFNTNLKGVVGEMFKLPYKQQLISLPDTFTALLIPEQNKDGVPYKVQGIYLLQEPSEEGLLQLRILVISNWGSNTDLYDERQMYLRLVIGPGLLEDQIRAQLDRMAVKCGLDDKFNGSSILSIADKLFKFILNVVLYINSPDAVLDKESWVHKDPSLKKLSSKARAKQIKRLKSLNNVLYIKVGVNGVLSREDRDSYREGVKCTTRTLVMGHWRRYHVGAGRVKIITKWIQPFWRGEGIIRNSPHKICI